MLVRRMYSVGRKERERGRERESRKLNIRRRIEKVMELFLAKNGSKRGG